MLPLFSTKLTKTESYTKTNSQNNKYTLNITLNADKDYFLEEKKIVSMFTKLEEKAKELFLPARERNTKQEEKYG